LSDLKLPTDLLPSHQGHQSGGKEVGEWRRNNGGGAYCFVVEEARHKGS